MHALFNSHGFLRRCDVKSDTRKKKFSLKAFSAGLGVEELVFFEGTAQPRKEDREEEASVSLAAANWISLDAAGGAELLSDKIMFS